MNNRLKEIRGYLGISQSELGEMVGISQNSISSIEVGQYSPTLKTALKIEKAINRICNQKGIFTYRLEEIFWLDLEE